MVAKLGNREDPLPQDSFEGVDEDEWVSGRVGPACLPGLPHAPRSKRHPLARPAHPPATPALFPQD